MPLIIAATGHRPPKLGGYSDAVFDKLTRFAVDYLKGRSDYVSCVISGMALGWDQAWATAAVAVGIPLVAAVPFEGQESIWPELSQLRYSTLLRAAHRVEIVSKSKPLTSHSAAGVMNLRNQWMVDNCQRLVALWDGSSGGTANCVRYAERVGRPVENIWEAWHKGARP